MVEAGLEWPDTGRVAAPLDVATTTAGFRAYEDGLEAAGRSVLGAWGWRGRRVPPPPWYGTECWRRRRRRLGRSPWREVFLRASASAERGFR